MSSCIGAIDRGTTSTRFMSSTAPAASCRPPSRSTSRFTLIRWVGHDPEEIRRRTQAVIADAPARRSLRASDLAAIGTANQRATTIVWDRQIGEPVTNAIVWQDARVAADAAEFTKTGGPDRLRARTGLPLSTYFSSLKIRGFWSTFRGVRARAENGEVLFGAVDTFLVSKRILRCRLVANPTQDRLLTRAVQKASPDRGRKERRLYDNAGRGFAKVLYTPGNRNGARLN